LFRANTHLPLRARQAAAHVTYHRSAHPRFTSTSPILAGVSEDTTDEGWPRKSSNA